MDKIIKKDYEWGKAALNQNLVLGTISSILALGILGVFLMTGEITAGSAIMFILFLGGSFLGIVSYISMTKNRIFIQTTDDGINISPILMDFIFSRQVIKWEDISKIETKKFGKSQKIVLSLLTGKNIKIKLGYLNKNDRENLAESIFKKEGH